MRGVDTNVVVRMITRDDTRQAAAADAFIERGAWVGHLVLVETTWVLRTIYGLAPSAIAAAVEMLLSHEHLTIQDADVVSAALAQYRRHPRVDFSDCLALETARKAGHLPIGTFDRHFARIDGTHRI
jgi:predicted nucleic-acid-binding protein